MVGVWSGGLVLRACETSDHPTSLHKPHCTNSKAGSSSAARLSLPNMRLRLRLPDGSTSRLDLPDNATVRRNLVRVVHGCYPAAYLALQRILVLYPSTSMLLLGGHRLRTSAAQQRTPRA